MRRHLCLIVGSILVCTATVAAQTRPATPAVKAPAPPVAAGMTNADVIKLVKAGLGENIIISSIRQAEKRSFVLNTDGLVELKTAGVSDNIIRIMLDPTAAPAEAPPPTVAPAKVSNPAAPAAADAPLVPEIGVYFKRDNAWADLLPEVVNWKTGGVLKKWASMHIIKGDVNGFVNGHNSRTVVKNPIEILIYAPEGTAVTEYQLLRLRQGGDGREFRTVTGGVMHESGGSVRDLVPFESKKLAPRTYAVILPNLGVGEYGLLSPGAVASSSASAQLGKIYTFRIE